MTEPGKFLSVGYGAVGQAVPERAKEVLSLEQAPYVIKKDGIFDLDKIDENGVPTADPVSANQNFWEEDEVMRGVEIGFLTIPSHADGERALSIIKGFVDRDIPIVTVEKGALANFHEELKPHFSMIGRTATVGGGTHVLPMLSMLMNSRTNRFHMVPNGTWNFTLDGLANGRPAGQIMEEARTLALAEPKDKDAPPMPVNEDHLSILAGELGDKRLKKTITWNHVVAPHTEAGTIVTPSDFTLPTFNLEDWARIKAEAEVRRDITSFERAGHETPENDIIVKSRKEVDGWVITDGVRRIDLNPIFKKYLVLPGPFNGAIIDGGPGESDGMYQVGRGPGAGPGPTAFAAVQDGKRILDQRA